jgi:assimilatory nitrate reductase catalytic subunit
MLLTRGGVQPQHDFPTNRGGLCSKGWTATTLLDHPQRLLTPLVRSVPGDRTSEFRAASWNEALSHVVSKIVELQAAHGPDSIGCFGGGGLTNEKAYAFGKFARVALGTSMIDYNGRFCMSSAAAAANRAFGDGISYERIEAEQGIFWPCPSEDHPGTPRLFTDRFPTPDGRANFIRAEYHEPDERPNHDYPYVLTTGRLMAQYQSGTQTRRVPSTSQAQVQPEAQLHPDLAGRLKIGNADIVQLSTRRGSAAFRAVINTGIRQDVVFVPFHWGGASAANALTNPALDPYSRMPAFKVCAVAVRRLGSPDDLHLLSSPPAAITRERRTSNGKDAHMINQNRFLQGIYHFEGAGLDKPVPISADLSYLVPDGLISQALYFRGGNTTDELITVILMRDGVPMRYLPIGARGDVHVPLRVVEDIDGGSAVELQLVASLGLSGHVVVDLGMVEH